MITSATNERIRALRRLLREPDPAYFAVEGVRALEETVRAGVRVDSVFYSARLDSTPRGLTLLESLGERGAEIVHVSEALLEKTSATERSQGIVAVLPRLSWRPKDLTAGQKPLFLLDGVRDPGNLGTLIRVADAFDIGGIAMTSDTVDPYNQKVVRSAMGSLFRVPLLIGDLGDLAAVLTEAGYRLVAADAAGAVPLADLPRDVPTAFIFGNEAQGLRAEARELARQLVRIPMPGGAESLNVAVTAAIVAYELRR
jgi:RNA methyltransferase, TrmH family